jgi:hypothetical protein
MWIFKEITNETEIPVGSNVVVVELEDVLNGTLLSLIKLDGFDEVGMFTETTMGFVNPVYGLFSKDRTKARKRRMKNE